MICLLGVINYSGLWIDVVGPLAVNEEDVKGTIVEGVPIQDMMTHDQEIYYNWDHGRVSYVFFLSALFMATIVLEGVDTSIMSKVTPSRLNGRFVNCGLLATLIGTLGRVLSDSMITGKKLEILSALGFLVSLHVSSHL